MNGNSVETDLRLAKEYWLQTVGPHIEGRKLRGIELFVAEDAHYRLQKVQEDAKGCSVSADALVDFTKDEFREPEELFRDENQKPETLAAIAAPLMQKPTVELTPVAAIGVAHELLVAAERYIKRLPEQKRGSARIGEGIGMAFSRVTFKEIAASNKSNSGQLPLLPGVYEKSRELKLPAFRAAVKRFLEEKKSSRPHITEAEWNREGDHADALKKTGEISQKLSPIGTGKPMTYQDWQKQPVEALNDALQNNRIILQDLCELRWQRFKTFWEKQSHAGSHKRRKTRKSRKSRLTSPGLGHQPAGASGLAQRGARNP